MIFEMAIRNINRNPGGQHVSFSTGIRALDIAPPMIRGDLDIRIPPNRVEEFFDLDTSKRYRVTVEEITDEAPQLQAAPAGSAASDSAEAGQGPPTAETRTLQ